MHGHIKGAGNGRGRQGEHVHLGPEGSKLFFLPHPKAVLLINDDEPQASVLKFLAEQLVRAYEDVDFSRL